jgi:CheY-like chemotaxis protein
MKKILCVDDSPTSLKIMEEVLKGKYEVRTAASAAQALKFLETDTADLFILDIVMPDMDGLTLLAKLQASEKHKKTPVLFITGQNEGDVVQKAIQQGAKGYIVKPIEPVALLKSIDFFIA